MTRQPRITLNIDANNKCLTVEDNGIGMSRDEMVQALGTIAHSGTKAFLDRVEAAKGDDGAALIGQFGVGFYSAFMVADRVDVISRRAGTDEASLWSSDGKGTFSVSSTMLAEAPTRGTRVILHLMEGATSYTERFTLERIVRAQSGHVPVPICNRRQARRRAIPDRGWCGAMDQTKVRYNDGGLYRLLKSIARPV